MNRPDCYEFALNFLGEPEQTELRRYIEVVLPWWVYAVGAGVALAIIKGVKANGN